jgi:hypothetical protein
MEEIQETGELPAATLMAQATRRIDVETEWLTKTVFACFERFSHGGRKPPIGRRR